MPQPFIPKAKYIRQITDEQERRRNIFKKSPKKFVIICDSRYGSGILFLQDQKIMEQSRKRQDRHWTKYPENAKIYNSHWSAEAVAKNFGYNHVRVVQISDLSRKEFLS